MSADLEEIRALVQPVVADIDLDLYDLRLGGGHPNPILTVVVDRASGLDLDTIATASRRISAVLDEIEPVRSSYTLEVSSPGVERPLRTPAHFEHAQGELVHVKYSTPEGPRRVKGRIVAVEGDRLTVETDDESVELSLADVMKARTVFEWGDVIRGDDRPGRSERRDADDASTARRGVKERTPR